MAIKVEGIVVLTKVIHPFSPPVIKPSEFRAYKFNNSFIFWFTFKRATSIVIPDVSQCGALLTPV